MTALLWTARTLTHIAAPLVVIAWAFPWFAEHHADADAEALARAIPLLVAAEIAWLLGNRWIRATIRLRTPGALGNDDTAPHPAEMIVAAVECTSMLTAIFIARESALTMDEVGTVLVALFLACIGTAIIPAIRRIYRNARDQVSAPKTRFALCALRWAIPGTVALGQGWTLIPDSFARDGHGFIVITLATIVVTLIAYTWVRGSRLPASSLNASASLPGEIIIGHRSSSRASIRELADDAGDAALRLVDASPTLKSRRRAHHWARLTLGAVAILWGTAALTLSIP
ncbi:hypothetical protein [Brachybacterium kimchii]|uniref:Transmembrane protein n=1 Tax=Brachybacterium kimchii TaxID=2942909 RepID=A0ABY4NC81_9MICO|nr:hypothetical protein [Brachybacterium kimchii]UQN31779.1 hypothetical protein M4486_19510 [Brachybacterium kimchii]